MFPSSTDSELRRDGLSFNGIRHFVQSDGSKDARSKAQTGHLHPAGAQRLPKTLRNQGHASGASS